jgi:hypothetical protein
MSLRKSLIAGLLVFILGIPLNNFAYAWEILPSEDGFGTKRVLASTYYDEDSNLQSPDVEPNSERYGALALRCMDSQTEIIFAAYAFGKPLKWVKQSTVDVKFDNGKVEKWKITFPPDKTGIFFIDTKKMLQRILKSKQIAIRGSGYTKRISGNFDITNIGPVRTEFKKIGCKF